MATSREYGITKDGRPVTAYTLRNQNGVEVRCINYGCRITHLFAPAPDGTVADIVLGYDSLADYEADDSFQGAFIGRYGNRIRGAAFELGGDTYQLPRNDGDNYLHGSFHTRVFDAEIIGENSVSFTYTSPEGEDGFPGELWAGVTYTLTDKNELLLDYRAVSTADTYVNLTNHSYYNMAGGGDISGQLLTLNCDRFLEVGAGLMPTGRTPQVEGGAFDFRAGKPIGQDIGAEDPQLKLGNGYDHCMILQKENPDDFALAAIVKDPASGRTLRILTTQPAVQLYTGSFMNGRPGKGGVPLQPRTGFCLETQHYPDSPHFPDFPDALLRKGEPYHQATVWQIEV